jgi:copper(I)-binding protein
MRLFVTAAALAALALPAAAAEFRQGGLEARDPWSRPAAAGTNGAGYFTLVNHAAKADALVAAESPAAAKVEIHRMSMAGGVMSMTREARVALPPGGQASFAPGSYHLMLLRLKAPLKVGDKVPATLVFASGARLKLDLAVGLAAPAAEGAMDHMQMGH